MIYTEAKMIKVAVKIIVVIAMVFNTATIASADSPSNYVIGTDVISPTYGSSTPSKGDTRTDSVTGASIVCRADHSELTPSSNYSLVVYSRFTPSNTTDEYVLVHGANSTSIHVYRISDNTKVATLTYDSNSNHTIGEVNEVRWDYTGLFPTRVYFVRGMKFYQMDVLTENGQPTLIRDFTADFPGAVKIINDVEGDSSNDSRYWAWQVLDPYSNGNYPVRAIIVYDKQSDSILGTLNPSDVGHVGSLPRPNMVEISPLGNKVITHYGAASTHPSTLSGTWTAVGGDVWLLTGYKAFTSGNNVFATVTADGVSLTKTTEGTGSAADITTDNQYASNSTTDLFWVRLAGGADPNSQTIIADWGTRPDDVGTSIDAPHAWDFDFTNPINISVSETHSGWAFDASGKEWFVSQNNKTDWIEARDILTGTAINILYHGDLGWTNGFHFGKFYNRALRGWFLMSTYSTSSSMWGNNQLMMVELKATADSPIVWRIAPTYNNYQGSYRDEGPAALSYDGKSVYVTANWGTANGTGEVYQFLLPGSWYEHFPGDLHPDKKAPSVPSNLRLTSQ